MRSATPEPTLESNRNSWTICPSAYAVDPFGFSNASAIARATIVAVAMHPNTK
jgi:hypothetical protein